MPAKTWLRSLRVLELDNRRVLYRLLPNPEHTRRHLRNHMITIRNNGIRITTLTSTRVCSDLLRSPRSSACSPAPPANHDARSEEPLTHDEFSPNVFPQLILGCPFYPLERLLP